MLLSWQLRKSLRYLMSNLDDFDPSHDLLSYADIQLVDRYTLHLLHKFISQVTLISLALLLTDSVVFFDSSSFEKSAISLAHMVVLSTA